MPRVQFAAIVPVSNTLEYQDNLLQHGTNIVIPNTMCHVAHVKTQRHPHNWKTCSVLHGYLEDYINDNS